MCRPALQHSGERRWLCGSWSTSSLGSCTTRKERIGVLQLATVYIHFYPDSYNTQRLYEDNPVSNQMLNILTNFTPAPEIWHSVKTRRVFVQNITVS